MIAFYLFAIECLFADLITLINDPIYLHVVAPFVCGFVYFSFLFPCCYNGLYNKIYNKSIDFKRFYIYFRNSL